MNVLFIYLCMSIQTKNMMNQTMILVVTNSVPSRLLTTAKMPK